VRVVFVINSLGAGGTERSTAVLLPHLRERGIEAVVVCLLHRDEGDEASVIEQGFDVRFVHPTRLVGRVRAVRAILRELQPDVVHTAIFEADVVGRLAAFRLGVPVLTSLVNTPYDASRRDDPNVVPWKLEVVRAIDSVTGRLGNAHFHAVTPGVADDAVATLHFRRDRISVVERGRDPQAFGRRDESRRARVRASLGLAADDRLIVAVGRQEYQKAHAHLVEAVRELVQDGYPPVVLAIAGRRGNASDALDDAIRASGLGDRARLLGHRDDIADLLVAADVFAMPSRYEGTAGAAIEAMALEVPIVATDLTGTAGILEHEVNALLVPVGDPAALAKAIRATLEHPEDARARASRARQDFEDRFTLERSADRMAALYERVAYR
jgi:glycosyltransferase involved in cell wall biosynthesis